MKKLYILLVAIAMFSFGNTVNAQCTAAFTSSNIANVFSFTDASTTSSGTIITWFWNFGDLTAPVTTQNPFHTYTVCGTYNVSLTIATTFFCTNTYTTTVTVNSGMTGSYTSTVDTTTGTTTFQASPLALNIDYSWDFGDATTGTGPFATHTYAASGTYYACLTVSDTGGICSYTYCDSVDVYIAPATCSTTFSYTDNGSGNVSFMVSPFDFGMTYNWDYGDGTTGTGAFAFHTYSTAGTYYPCLTAVDSATMCISFSCDTIVLPADPAACNFTFNYIDNSGMVGFSASPLSGNSYTWDFGDGQTATGPITSNTYATGGIYYVCATITDAFNACTNTYCDSVIVAITGIDEKSDAGLLFSAYPNPVQDQVTISYKLTGSATVTIDIVDVVGKNVFTLSEQEDQGIHSRIINTDKLSKGAYFMKISTENSNSGKLLIKN
jgi:PKD repeat protein